MREAIERINAVVYAIEKAIVVVAMVVMAVIVFLDVAHRQWTNQHHKLGEVLAIFARAKPGDPAFATLQSIAGPLWIVVVLVLLFLASRTASRRSLWAAPETAAKGGVGTRTTSGADRSPPHHPSEPAPGLSVAASAGIAVGGLVLGWLVMRVLFGDPLHLATECEDTGYSWHCGYFSSGLFWAQPMALVLTIWASFLGASMAASDLRHLRVEAVQKALPPTARRIIGSVGWVFAAGFCVFVAYLSWRFVAELRQDYLATQGGGGSFEGTAIPRWQGFLVLPFSFAVMAVRFVGTAVLTARGEAIEVNAELGNVDLEAVAMGIEAQTKQATGRDVEGGKP